MSGAIKHTFTEDAKCPPQNAKKQYPKPVSVRFIDEKRSELERKGGNLTLGSYIRSQCVGDVAAPRIGDKNILPSLESAKKQLSDTLSPTLERLKRQ